MLTAMGPAPFNSIFANQFKYITQDKLRVFVPKVAISDPHLSFFLTYCNTDCVPRQATASDLPIYSIFAQQKVPLSKIFDDVVTLDWWFGLPSQSKILATLMTPT